MILEGIACRFNVRTTLGKKFTRAALENAVPDYFKRSAPVCVSHSPFRVGRVISCEFRSYVMRIRFEVTEPVALRWIETGAIRGLSVGGISPKGGTVNGVIRELKLNEISLCRKPACPGCFFEPPL